MNRHRFSRHPDTDLRARMKEEAWPVAGVRCSGGSGFGRVGHSYPAN